MPRIKKHKAWADHEVKQALFLYREKSLSYTEIGIEIGRSRNAVAGMLHREGVQGISKKLRKNVEPCPDAFTNALRNPGIRKAIHYVDKKRTVQRQSPGHKIEPIPPKPLDIIDKDWTFLETKQTTFKIPCTLLEAGPEQCRWPIGIDPRTMLFCGLKVKTGSSYCPEHARVGSGGLTSLSKMERDASKAQDRANTVFLK